MRKITPFLWFENQAEEAVRHYISIFKESRIVDVARHRTEGVPGNPGGPGTVLTISFELEGQSFMALNGGPQFKFTEAISFLVDCADQAEVDYYWTRLLEGGGTEMACGWLKDRYGVSWQIVPTILGTLLSDPDPVKAQRVMAAMFQMVKLDVAQLKAAYGAD